MSKTYNTQLPLPLKGRIPPEAKAKLIALRDECRRKADEWERQQVAAERLERYQTWQEVKLSSFKLR